MKLIGIKFEDINKYAFDYCSILHFIFGIIAYIIIFSIFCEVFLSLLLVILGSIFWEMVENTILIDIKVNKRQDSILNSQSDTLSVFFGCMCGCLLYNRSNTLVIGVIGLLFVLYAIAVVLTYKKFQRH